MSERLQFDEPSHTYKLDGNPIPGLTTMIDECGYREKGAGFYTTASRQRGNAVHKVTELIDIHAPQARTIDEALYYLNIDERLIGYAAGYLLFKKETNFQPEIIEKPVAIFSLRVGCIPDRWGKIWNGQKVVVDLKSWKGQGIRPKHPAELQTAGQAMAFRESMALDTSVRILLKLPGDGSYRQYVCNNQRDEMTLAACATIFWDRYANGYVTIKGDEPETGEE